MAKNYEQEAKAILKLVGVNNVDSVTHCQTRLRFVVKDRKAIDDKALEQLPEVKGVFYGSGQYQVIIGTGVVNDVYAAIAKLGTVNAIYGKDDADTTAAASDEHKTWVQRDNGHVIRYFHSDHPRHCGDRTVLRIKKCGDQRSGVKAFWRCA